MKNLQIFNIVKTWVAASAKATFLFLTLINLNIYSMTEAPVNLTNITDIRGLNEPIIEAIVASAADQKNQKFINAVVNAWASTSSDLDREGLLNEILTTALKKYAQNI